MNLDQNLGKKKRIFILEDNELRRVRFREFFEGHDVTYTEDSNEAIKILRKEKFDYLFLDHDLGGMVYVDSGEPNTGYQVAKIIPETENKNARIVIHSWNPEGAKNMMEALNGCIVKYSPFGMFGKNALDWRWYS